MAETKKSIPENIRELLKIIKLDYISGRAPIKTDASRHGFNPTKNAALNFGRLMSIPYDPEMRIRKNDPAQQLRGITSRIGTPERIHNVYVPGRVKLAD
jgi:hypothetical protein